jgi:hypothetical protein
MIRSVVIRTICEIRGPSQFGTHKSHRGYYGFDGAPRIGSVVIRTIREIRGPQSVRDPQGSPRILRIRQSPTDQIGIDPYDL